MKYIVLAIFSLLASTCFGQSYRSNSLITTQLSPNTWIHTSYFESNTFGKVPCNGMIVRENKKAIIFDTPPTNQVAEELINFVKDSLKLTIIAIVPTHFHEDCLGGLEAFHQQKISSYAHRPTIELAKKQDFTLPQNSFDKEMKLSLDKSYVLVKFFGEGHTKDNVIAYYPDEKILFGGCLIKELGANKGNLADANVATWSNTVQAIKSTFKDIHQVIPGHGKHGTSELLDYTIRLFKQ